MKEFYWIGYSEFKPCGEVFSATETEATPENTGYDEVSGPFDTKEEAEAQNG